MCLYFINYIYYIKCYDHHNIEHCYLTGDIALYIVLLLNMLLKITLGLYNTFYSNNIQHGYNIFTIIYSMIITYSQNILR